MSYSMATTMIKKNTKFSSYLRKFKWEMHKYFYQIYEELVIYDFLPPIPLNFLIYEKKIYLIFLSVQETLALVK
jgi:hypothetical protein